MHSYQSPSVVYVNPVSTLIAEVLAARRSEHRAFVETLDVIHRSPTGSHLALTFRAYPGPSTG